MIMCVFVSLFVFCLFVCLFLLLLLSVALFFAVNLYMQNSDSDPQRCAKMMQWQRPKQLVCRGLLQPLAFALWLRPCFEHALFRSLNFMPQGSHSESTRYALNFFDALFLQSCKIYVLKCGLSGNRYKIYFYK
jgi:hypothetical protein